jgi:hypothetical protein
MATMFQIIQFSDGNGVPLDSGKVFWYEAGTSTPKNTWVDEAESATAANPVLLDSDGRPDHGSGPAAMWLRGSYKMVLKDKNDNTIITIDDINLYDQLDWTGLTATIADLNSTSTETLLKTSVYTVQVADRGKTILADATSGTFVINLPTAASVGNKFKIIIKKIDNNATDIDITPAGSEVIDIRDEYKLHDYFDFIEIHSNGSNWYVVASQIRGTVRSVTAVTTLDIKDNKKLVNADASTGTFDINLPSAVVVGKGWWVTIKKVDSSTNNVSVKAPGSQTIDGASTIPISTQYFALTVKSDGINYYIQSEFGDTASGGALPKGYLRGYKLVQTTSSIITFKEGAARSEDNTLNIINSDFSKDFASVWKSGPGQGGLASGAVRAVNKFYFAFEITTSTGVVDAGFDDNINAVNLLADAAPEDFTAYKRVGVVKSGLADSAIVRDFFMEVLPGGQRITYWKTLVLDDAKDDQGLAPFIPNLAKSIPPLPVRAIMNVSFLSVNTNDFIYLYNPNQTAQIPTGASFPLFTVSSVTSDKFNGSKIELLTGTDGTIRAIQTSTVGRYWAISVIGWEE